MVSLSDLYLAGHLPVPAGHLDAVLSARTTSHYVAWFITCYNVLVTVGSTALVARFIGAGRSAGLPNIVTHQALLLACAMALVASVLGLAGGLRLMVEALQLEGLAADYAEAYLQPLFLLLVFQIVEAAGIACLVGAGDTRTGLWVMVGVALLNIPLAWGFGWGLGPLPRMGFVGIAVGTALSHTLGGSVVALACCSAAASACSSGRHCSGHASTCCAGCCASACRPGSTACRWSRANSGSWPLSTVWGRQPVRPTASRWCGRRWAIFPAQRSVPRR